MDETTTPLNNQVDTPPVAKKNEDKTDKALFEIDRASLKEQSDREYRKITNTIIATTKEQLTIHNSEKKPLRTDLLYFIRSLLCAQFVFLMFILLFNSSNFHLSDAIITTYVVSVFAETLAGFLVMVKFAYDSSQEIKLIEILNSIVKFFQKV